MRKIVTVKKQGLNLLIELDVSKIVAITEKTEKDNIYYIYFDSAVWAVQGNSYDTVRNAWLQ